MIIFGDVFAVSLADESRRGGFNYYGGHERAFPQWLRFSKAPYNAGRPSFPGPVLSLGLSSVSLPLHREVLSAGSRTPRLSVVCSQLSALSCVGLSRLCVRPPRCRWHHQVPRVAFPILALPRSGRRGPPPARTLLPGHSSCRLMRRSHSLSSPSA